MNNQRSIHIVRTHDARIVNPVVQNVVVEVGPITYESAQKFVRDFEVAVLHAGVDGVVPIVINSPGGTFCVANTSVQLTLSRFVSICLARFL